MRTTQQKWVIVGVKKRRILDTYIYMLIKFNDIGNHSKKRCILSSKEEAEKKLEEYKTILVNSIEYEKKRLLRINDPKDITYAHCTPAEKVVHIKNTNAAIIRFQNELAYADTLEVKELKITYTTI